jgi:hypothetical protein
LRSSAKAFRENTVYDSDGDAFRLGVQADECDEAATAIESLLADRAAAEAVERACWSADTPRPIATAPKDGTMLWLLVDYGGDGIDGDHPLADASIAWTIGFNNLEADGKDQWKFTGWCWSHDHFTEGRGQVPAWKPLGFDLDADDLAAAFLAERGEG